ncbi:MAG TPA: ABC transporter permease [Longimicrobiales bacterium]
MRTLDTVRVITPRSRGSAKEVWRFRDLYRSLVARDLAAKYHSSVLGFIWTLLNPLLMLAVLIAVFRHVIRVPIEHYWAFLLSGYFVWNCAQQCLSAATYVLQQHANLSRSAAFPSEILLLSASTAKHVEFLIEIGLTLVVLGIFHHQAVPGSFLALPVLFLLQFVLVVGLMAPIAVLSVLFRDVQHALPPIIMAVFYLSPVFYSTDMVPESVRGLYMLNPFAGLLSLYHAVLFEGRFPAGGLLGWVATLALASCAGGYMIFRRYKPLCVEVA